MARHVLIGQTNATDGRDTEFQEWYDNVHLVEVLRVPGFVSATRYELDEEPEMPPAAIKPTYRYLTVYELEGDACEVMLDFEKMRPTFTMSESLQDERWVAVYKEVAPRRTPD